MDKSSHYKIASYTCAHFGANHFFACNGVSVIKPATLTAMIKPVINRLPDIKKCNGKQSGSRPKGVSHKIGGKSWNFPENC